MAVTSQRTAPQLYKDSLTPALHRRFTRAAGIALLTCYVESVCIADKSSCMSSTQSFLIWTSSTNSLSIVIWSWFPLGPAGIRTLLLFISALAVFVLRVAQLHSMWFPTGKISRQIVLIFKSKLAQESHHPRCTHFVMFFSLSMPYRH